MEISLDQERIKTNGIHLNVVQGGAEDGALTILLHGFPEYWYGWRHQIAPLSAAGLRLWMPDQRGYNLSDKPRGIRNYRIDMLVEDIVGLIQAAGQKKARIVGHDWGGMVAWWLALRHPEMVEKLVILNVPHPQVFAKTLRTDSYQLRKSWYAAMFQLPFLPEAIMKRDNWEVGLKAVQNTGRDDTFTSADLEKYREAWSYPGAMTAMLNWYRAYVQYPPKSPQSWRIRVPTLMIWGENDFALSRKMPQPSIDLCDDGRLVMIKNATHWVQHDEPSQVNQLLIELLKP